MDLQRLVVDTRLPGAREDLAGSDELIILAQRLTKTTIICEEDSLACDNADLILLLRVLRNVCAFGPSAVQQLVTARVPEALCALACRQNAGGIAL